ncbi:uncharacterized protein K02A2.6-like [Anopheles funestus]|uniref:uncharacterized protein K02A2.6-like n=1 Tax=Anopheles funestus TaxID=62324 RepID=UPI0020C6544D|nr:uncharacterized protein K02A2.6-like [Anopheles funestus]
MTSDRHKQDVCRIEKPPLNQPAVQAKTATGAGLQICGEFQANIKIGSITKTATIRVVTVDISLLGADLIELFNLGSIPMDSFCNKICSVAIPSSIQQQFPAVFSGTGLCTKAQVQLHLKHDCRPVFSPKRPVAYAMQETVDQELDRLEKAGIITPTDYSEWAAPIVVVRKANGTIRICGDYSTGLNSALKSHEHPLPVPEDIFAKLAHCEYFSKIDLSDAFLQVEIEEQYRPLLTINTHLGLYLYNRLPPGVKIAPAAFQQIMDAMLAGIKGACGYMDDVVVGGRTSKEHDDNLSRLLHKIQDYGFTIREEKCAFKTKSIEYLGYNVDRNGLKPNPAKIAAILNLPAPTDVSGVRSFLGAVNYYGKFVPKMRDLRYPLDNLLKNDGKFTWNQQCEKAFRTFKEILSSKLLLTHYDPAADIIVAADASSVGLGATISHKFPDGSVKVVQHASRALSKAEQNYSQIDREGLAIVFAVTKFHKMLYGRHFHLQTDHRPLLRIFGSKKGIPVYTANRLQRFALTLQLYDFSIEYVPTGSFGNADVLSRLIRDYAKPESDYIIASLNVQKATQEDTLLRKLSHYVTDGWPRNASFGSELARFHHRKEGLSTVDGCILFGERLVIPEKLRARCLTQLHRGHPGIQRMKALARSYVYWPSLDNDVQDVVATCPACAVAAKSPPHSAPAPWPKVSTPWQRVHIDYAGPLNGEYFLVVVDAFTKWPEIIKTSSTTAVATIAILRSIFARFGVPVTIISDNGTQFVSSEFKEFCLKNGINHITTAPFHPQSNGQAERFVDTFKRAIKKITYNGLGIQEALDIFLQTYRSTPNAQLENSTPAKLMFGRPIRTCLELLHPVPTPLLESQHGTRRGFQNGAPVYAKLFKRNSWEWLPGTVVGSIGRVMYKIRTKERIIRSHINQLRKRAGDNERVTHDANPKVALDLLMDTWNIPLTSSIQYSDPRSPTPILNPPAATVMPNIPTVFSPRRSSRPRRVPRRFDAYRLN